MCFERRDTSTAAGRVSSPRTASTSATHERLLLFDVGAASGCGRGWTSDHTRDGDQHEHGRQGLEEDRRVAPRLCQPERERRRRAEQEGSSERAEGAPVAEDDGGERDEATTVRHVLVERPDEPDRQI